MTRPKPTRPTADSPSAGQSTGQSIGPSDDKATAIDSLKRRIESVDSSDIDQLYGLEPVFEPDRPGAELERFVAFQCPWCGERMESRVDLTAGEREYIEDCEVCCRPIEFGIELEEDGSLRALRVQRLD